MRYPSVTTLLQVVPDQDRALARAVRKVLDGTTPLTMQDGFRGGDLRLGRLCTIDKMVGNHGIEWVGFECDKDNHHDPHGFEFSNTGDTYASTLVLYKGRFRVTSWGDMVEGHERRCARCQKRRMEDS